MRFTSYSIAIPAWTVNDYGENEKTIGSTGIIHALIGWNARTEAASEGSIYEQYDLVGLTRDSSPAIGSVIDGKYEVKRVEPGRIKRIFMNYVEGYDRDYIGDELGTFVLSESSLGPHWVYNG